MPPTFLRTTAGARRLRDLPDLTRGAVLVDTGRRRPGGRSCSAISHGEDRPAEAFVELPDGVGVAVAEPRHESLAHLVFSPMRRTGHRTQYGTRLFPVLGAAAIGSERPGVVARQNQSHVARSVLISKDGGCSGGGRCRAQRGGTAVQRRKGIWNAEAVSVAPWGEAGLGDGECRGLTHGHGRTGRGGA